MQALSQSRPLRAWLQLRAGELGEEPGVRLRLCGRETRAASTRRGRHAGEQVGGEAGPRLGLRCQERPSEPARQLLQRLRGLGKRTQGSETPQVERAEPTHPGAPQDAHQHGGLVAPPPPTPPTHTHGKGTVRLSGWTPLLQGPLRTPGRTPALGLGAGGPPRTHPNDRRCGSSPGPSCHGTGPNGTCSQASRSFSLISPHLRLRLRPYPGESR